MKVRTKARRDAIVEEAALLFKKWAMNERQ